jgi:hypothetical protein
MPVSISGTNGITFPDNSLQTAAASPFGLKNRLINADMRIDQRNNGASVSLPVGTATGLYPIDRWAIFKGTAGGFTGQRSTLAPAGFTNSIQFTVTNAVTPASTDFFGVRQNIEGLNVDDLGWGTANAQTVTLSFWIRCSVTGTYNWSLMNSAETRGYVASFTVNSANTWEYKTLTIPGDTSGTWLTNNGVGVRVYLDLGTGSTYSTTAGSWQTFNFAYGLTGGTKFIANAGATMNVTGVQLERNTTATPFEWIPYGTELALCQRYYHRITPAAAMFGSAFVVTSTQARSVIPFPVTMRIAPTALEQTGTASNYGVFFNNTFTNCSAVPTFSASTTLSAQTTLTVASGLTGGQAGNFFDNSPSSNAYLGWSAEL